MLERLYIKNVALIEESEIEFSGKLNILSGETGSGKSVILESINFILGSKADKTMIRSGENEAFVRAEFLVDSSSVAIKKLNELDIESDGSIIITRKLSADGRGGIKINGNSVTSGMLKTVTQHLVDVHGQSEHFFLFNESNQLRVLDNLLNDELKDLKNSLSQIILENKNIKQQISVLGGNASEREQRLSILEFQIGEIEKANLKIGEFEELKAKQSIINNTEKILTALNTVRAAIREDGGCLDGVTAAKHSLNSVSVYSEKYAALSARLEEVNAELSDISETVSDFSDELFFDSAEAQLIDERISLIKSLRKKYGSDESEILDFLSNAKEQFLLLSQSAEAIEKLNAQIATNNAKIFELCTAITRLRKNAAQNFCKEVVSELNSLNIPNVNFSVSFNNYDESTVNLTSAEGSDDICFMFSANKGEPLKPLGKVISGGEMSRFMLAIKTVLKDINGISTYIFDEIDAGISGYTAKTVAEKFIKISIGTQIIAVSHLPQVCAASDKQFFIYKTDLNDKTVTKVKELDEESKIKEIIRLTGGNSASETSIKHAKELVAQFKK